MPNKNELIDRIRQINLSADGRWLEAFDQRALMDYLEHLQVVMEPRGRNSIWRRRGDTAAVVGRTE
ncbi:MAG: hypothetical protein SGJ09_13035 [Phycisphaerae bacterium]|nr:hypothetical protein [Phycisphaerae bacterium]